HGLTEPGLLTPRCTSTFLLPPPPPHHVRPPSHYFPSSARLALLPSLPPHRTPSRPGRERLATAGGTKSGSGEVSGCQRLVEDITTCRTTVPFRVLTISVNIPEELSQ